VKKVRGKKIYRYGEIERDGKKESKNRGGPKMRKRQRKR
jgi:hypothetical protein